MLAYFLLVTGFVGCLGMSVLFSCIAILFRKNRSTAPSNSSASNITILIPAHNEEGTVQSTIQSILISTKLISAKIIVGADACTDNTVEIAKKAGAHQILIVNNRSKWKTLLKLIQECETEWIALVDSGAIWPENLIACIKPYLQRAEYMAIAPAYDPKESNYIEKVLWKIERALKKIETVSIGPTSLHGATIFYRTNDLKKALILLGEKEWLNDDIAIPIALYSSFPQKRIFYYPGENSNSRVSDIGLQSNKIETKRRFRMMVGNIDWIQSLLPLLYKTNSLAFLIAQRRVFRVFWFYWITCILLGFSLMMKNLIILIPLLFFLTILNGASTASILAPFYLLKANKKVQWK